MEDLLLEDISSELKKVCSKSFEEAQAAVRAALESFVIEPSEDVCDE